MKKVKINEEINEKDYTNNLKEEYINLYLEYIKFNPIINKILKKLNLKFIFLLCIFFIFLIFNFINKGYLPNPKLLKSFKKYINDCKKNKKYIFRKNKNEIPYVSICLSALNMEKYIKQNLLSILNQSFQDFEIIVINDHSNDDTEKIIKEMQLEDDRIILINHSQNLGVYRSRIETILNAKSKYIMLMDPDDMYLNQNLIRELYNYNKINNLDIIEFSVYHQNDGSRKIIYPDNHFQNHFHNFDKKIIYQPELSEILYYLPRAKQYSHTICRNIWNKIIRVKILLDVHHYIGNDYYNEFVITADDMAMNIILYNFANNYSNIDLPGYLYNIRKESMSRTGYNNNHDIIVSYNFLLYLKLFYKYIKDFKKDLNFFIYEFTISHKYLFKLKDLNTKYDKIALNFFYMINKTIKIKNNINSKDYKIKKIKNNNILKNFPKLVKKLILYFNKKY